MKKLLSVVLLLMLFTLCFSLASCGDGVSVDDVNENALKVMVEAAKNTNNKFFASEDGDSAWAAMTGALENGAVEIGFDAGKLASMLPVDLKDANVKFFFNDENGEYAVSASAKVNGEAVDGVVFLDKDGLKVMSNAILGNNTAYALNIGSFIEKFEDSIIAEMMGGIPDGAFDAYEVYMQAFKTEFEEFMTETEIQADNLVNVLLNKLAPSVKEADGAIIITYTMNNKTVEALLKTAVEEAAKIAKLDAATKGMLTEGVANIVTMMNETATINCKAEIYLNADDNTISKTVVGGEVTADGMTMKLNLTTTCTANEYKMTETMEMAGQKMTTGMTVTRTAADNGDVTYKMVATGSMNEGAQFVEFTACELVAAYKANGNVSVKVSIPANMGSGDTNMTTYELIGSLDLSNGAKFTFTSVKMGDTVLVEGVKLTVSFVPGASAPSTGAVKDIVDLTEADLNAIQKALEDGFLGAFMPGSDPSSGSVSMN